MSQYLLDVGFISTKARALQKTPYQSDQQHIQTRGASFVGTRKGQSRAKEVVRLIQMLGRLPFELFRVFQNDEAAPIAFESPLVQMLIQN